MKYLFWTEYSVSKVCSTHKIGICKLSIAEENSKSSILYELENRLFSFCLPFFLLSLVFVFMNLKLKFWMVNGDILSPCAVEHENQRRREIKITWESKKTEFSNLFWPTFFHPPFYAQSSSFQDISFGMSVTKSVRC